MTRKATRNAVLCWFVLIWGNQGTVVAILLHKQELHRQRIIFDPAIISRKLTSPRRHHNLRRKDEIMHQSSSNGETLSDFTPRLQSDQRSSRFLGRLWDTVTGVFTERSKNEEQDTTSSSLVDNTKKRAQDHQFLTSPPTPSPGSSPLMQIEDRPILTEAPSSAPKNNTTIDTDEALSVAEKDANIITNGNGQNVAVYYSWSVVQHRANDHDNPSDDRRNSSNNITLVVSYSEDTVP